MSRVFLFPGQGSQFVGMAKDLCEAYPTAARMMQRAHDVLGYDLSEIMWGTGLSEEDAAERLKQTQYTQPALFVHSAIAGAVLQEKGLTPEVVAGHSLGELSALYAAGVCDFETALGLVSLRGTLMAEAGVKAPGAMSAVLGMSDEDVSAHCEATASSGAVVVAANFNAPGQVVISGSPEGVAAAGEACQQAGAKRVVPLPVSGAFHSPLMAYAAPAFNEALRAATFEAASCDVYINVTAEVERDPEILKQRLVEQLTSPVRWSQTLANMKAKGCTTFFEVGAGRVLSGLLRTTLGREWVATPLGTADQISARTTDQ